MYNNDGNDQFKIESIDAHSVTFLCGPFKIVAQLELTDRGIKFHWPRGIFVTPKQNNVMRRIGIAEWARVNNAPRNTA